MGRKYAAVGEEILDDFILAVVLIEIIQPPLLRRNELKLLYYTTSIVEVEVGA